MLQSYPQVPASQLILFTGVPFAPTQQNIQQPLPSEMLTLFEQVTGWVVEFAESKTSYLQRQLSGNHDQQAEGNYSILDMSAAWPAGRPTGHRAKCDRLVELLSGLAGELQSTKKQLAQTQSLLEAYAPGSVEDDDAPLVDCFIPEFADDDQWDVDFVVTQLNVDFEAARLPVGDPLIEMETVEFENPEPWNEAPPSVTTQLQFEPLASAVNPPFEGWQLGGAPGVVEGRYIDWCVDSDERIQLSAGQTGAVDGGSEQRESVLSVDPLTNEYSLSADDRFFFLLCDLKTHRMSRIEASSKIGCLMASQMILVSASEQLGRLIEGSDLADVFSGDVDDDAARLTSAYGEPVLILRRN